MLNQVSWTKLNNWETKSVYSVGTQLLDTQSLRTSVAYAFSCLALSCPNLKTIHRSQRSQSRQTIQTSHYSQIGKTGLKRLQKRIDLPSTKNATFIPFKPKPSRKGAILGPSVLIGDIKYVLCEIGKQTVSTKHNNSNLRRGVLLIIHYNYYFFLHYWVIFIITISTFAMFV
jgi:hypothetical protein